MDLRTYIRVSGRNLHQLSLRAGIAYQTALRALEGRVNKATAGKLSDATEGEVTPAEILFPPKRGGDGEAA